LDINTPEVDGGILNEAAKLFHEDVEVIVCSARPAEEQKEIIQDADDYHEKSQGLNELFLKIKSALRV